MIDVACKIGEAIADSVRQELTLEGRSGWSLTFTGIDAQRRMHFGFDNGVEDFDFHRPTNIPVRQAEVALLAFCLENTTDPVPYNSPCK